MGWNLAGMQLSTMPLLAKLRMAERPGVSVTRARLSGPITQLLEDQRLRVGKGAGTAVSVSLAPALISSLFDF